MIYVMIYIDLCYLQLNKLYLKLKRLYGEKIEPKILTFKDFCLFLSAQRFNNLWNVKTSNIRAKKGQFEAPKKTELDVKKTSILKVPVLKNFCRYWLSTKVCREIRRKVIIEIIVSQNYLSFGVLKSVVKVNVL